MTEDNPAEDSGCEDQEEVSEEEESGSGSEEESEYSDESEEGEAEDEGNKFLNSMFFLFFF